MYRSPATCIVVVAILLSACDRDEPVSAASTEASVLCSESRYRMIDEKVPTGDGQGHGPDIGSDEWKSVVEFKLGIRGEPDVPSRNSDAWCRHIDEIVRSRRTSSATSGNAGLADGAAGPSFD